MNTEMIEALKHKKAYDFGDLCAIMEILRGEGGCPWDREQTHESIRGCFIEETYEVVEAIDKSDTKLLCEELGDVLLQVVFHTQIEREAGGFEIGDVTGGVCRKLIERHPHIFADVRADTSEEVLKNWEKIKSEEKKRRSVSDKLEAIPRQLPALMRAAKVGEKAYMFDFPDAEAAFTKIGEETEELREVIPALTPESRAAAQDELGDLLFSAANLARKLDIDPELALTGATDKFIRRFGAVEERVRAAGGDVRELPMSELDAIWEEIKHK